jgi:riboflavin kinase/FMN adenylyltransferase
MRHFFHLTEAALSQPSVVTIGVFDGVHRGHQHLIGKLVQAAHASHRLAVVLTLFPHPDRVLRKIEGRYYLTSPTQKADLLGNLGVDLVITHPFDDEVRQIRAAAFMDLLIDRLHMNSLWVTRDFALGYQREGNFAFLTALGQERGFEVQQIELLQAEGDGLISSSHIREALLHGEVDKAAALLARPYRLEGMVVRGDQRGRTIGFPTANLDVWEEQIVPATGVYACRATLGEERLLAVTNIGYRPTFGGHDLRVEAHLLDFDRDIYGVTLQLDFVARLRGEQKFPGLNELIAQITADVARGRDVLKSASHVQRQ